MADFIPIARVPAVLQQPLEGPLPRAREVRLQGARARVLDGDKVAVVGPRVAEDVLGERKV